MELRQIILARALQVVRTLGTSAYLPDLVPKIRDRYGFVVVPEIMDLITSSDPSGGAKPAEFKHGKLELPGRMPVVIQQLAVFSDGIAVDTTTSTDDSDLIVNDLATWAMSEIPQATSMGPRYYISQIEVKSKTSFAHYRAVFQPIGDKLRALLKGYGMETPHFEMSAANLHFDQLGKPVPQPGIFYVDRSKAFPYSEDIWLSQAPLKTYDHLRLLEQMDI